MFVKTDVYKFFLDFFIYESESHRVNSEMSFRHLYSATRTLFSDRIYMCY